MQTDLLFYYALYQGLAQWAAFIAIFVVLLTIGFILSTSPNLVIKNPGWLTTILVVILLVEIYILGRIGLLGYFVHQTLGPAVEALQLVPHPLNLVGVGVVAAGICGWNISLVWARSPKQVAARQVDA